MPRALQDAFVFNTFFGGEPGDWALGNTCATVSDRFEMPAPTLAEFLLDRLCRPQNRVCSVSATRAARRQKMLPHHEYEFKPSSTLASLPFAPTGLGNGSTINGRKSSQPARWRKCPLWVGQKRKARAACNMAAVPSKADLCS
jgi:hypothetical protein